MPSCARLRITARTSRTSSGSSAEVASSKSITCGFMARARAMATRCCWPPESWLGIKSMRSPRPTFSSSLMAISSASSLERLSTFCWAIMTFFLTERCGNRLNCWNTMPSLARTALISTPLAVMSSPSNRILPPVGRSSRFTQRSIVDLPEPEGPSTTTTSPLWTSRSILRRTVRSPKDFSSPWMRTMGSSAAVSAVCTAAVVSLMSNAPYR